jgi:hypothetical protein
MTCSIQQESGAAAGERAEIRQSRNGKIACLDHVHGPSAGPRIPSGARWGR